MKTFHNDYLIIGAGIAGLSAATAIRSLSKTGSIKLINGENYPPYKRTSLSKYFASGFMPEDFTLVTHSDLQSLYDIELVGDTIEEIDYKGKRAISKQNIYQYTYLILATGARYELPAGLQHPKICSYHNKQETLSLQEQVKDCEHIAVLGAGVQGIETCYELLKLGKHVCLIDSNEIPLYRFRSPYISAYLQQDMIRRGVQCYWQKRIEQFSDSMLENWDRTICCFGTKPVTGLFPQNACLQPNLLIAPDVFACGDNIAYSSGLASDNCTLWHEAMDLGQLAGSNAVKLAEGMAEEELIKLQRKVYRTKIEVAGKILFFAPPIDLRINSPQTTVISDGKDSSEKTYKEEHYKLSDNTYYQLFFNQQGILGGASLLCEERELLKPLQQAIWEQAGFQQSYTDFKISESHRFDGTFQLSERK